VRTIIDPGRGTRRMNAKTIDVKASHLALISHPEEITNLIVEGAGYGK
jgi:hypothetical protein